MSGNRLILIAVILLGGLKASAQQIVIDPSQIAASATNAAEQVDYMLDQLGELAHLGDQMNSMREHIDNVFGEDGIAGKTISVLEDLGTLKRLTEAFDATAWRYMLVPDVALQKARVAISALRPHASIWSNNGYAFATELPTEQLPARIFEIESIEPYRPKELKRSLKGLGVEIMKRDTQLSVDAVRRAIGTKAGSDKLIAITTIAGGTWVINLKI
jgi:hypothetical protein